MCIRDRYATDLEPVTLAGEPHIEDHHSGPLPPHELEAGIAVGRDEHTEPVPPQVQIHEVRDIGVVLHDDNGAEVRAHRDSLAPMAPLVEEPVLRQRGRC